MDEHLNPDIGPLKRRLAGMPAWQLYTLAAKMHADAREPDPMGDRPTTILERAAWQAEQLADIHVRHAR